jgi:Flp pilus assembly CpaF family ATPase
LTGQEIGRSGFRIARDQPAINDTFDDLLKAALRWRPDRIILGEVRGTEANHIFVHIGD